MGREVSLENEAMYYFLSKCQTRNKVINTFKNNIKLIELKVILQKTFIVVVINTFSGIYQSAIDHNSITSCFF